MRSSESSRPDAMEGARSVDLAGQLELLVLVLGDGPELRREQERGSRLPPRGREPPAMAGAGSGARGGPALGGYGGARGRLAFALVASADGGDGDAGAGSGGGSGGGGAAAARQRALIEDQERELAALAGPGSPNSWMETASLGPATGTWEVRADLAIEAAVAHPLVQARVAAMGAAPGRRAGGSRGGDVGASGSRDRRSTLPPADNALATVAMMPPPRAGGSGADPSPAPGLGGNAEGFARGSQEGLEDQWLGQVPSTGELLRRREGGGRAPPSGKASPLPVRTLDFVASGPVYPAADPAGASREGALPVIRRPGGIVPPVTVEGIGQIESVQARTSAPLSRAGPSEQMPPPASGRGEGPSGKPQALTAYLPGPLAGVYAKKKNITQLHAWQAECINQNGGAALRGGSLLYCAPTSGGKSLVAEVLLLRRLDRVRRERKFAILVMPLIAVCEEKVALLEELLAPLNRRVLRNFGSLGIDKKNLPGPETGVIVCTIEKAYSLINRLVEEGRMDLVTMLVVDELHMVGDPRRGPNLERMLISVRHAALTQTGTQRGEGAPLQLVGMSATLPNLDSIGKWLGADVFKTSFRPVELYKYLVLEKESSHAEQSKLSSTDPPKAIIQRAVEREGESSSLMETCREMPIVATSPGTSITARIVATLANECLSAKERHSVLVFCESKAACIRCCTDLHSILGDPDAGVESVQPKRDLALSQCRNNRALSDCIRKGYIFHNASLNGAEREVVEELFGSKGCRVLAATTSLAVGVNLPARRVIIQKPFLGRPDTLLDGVRFDQMAGRAGRAGIDTLGEAFLLLPKTMERNKQKIVDAITKGPEKVLSMLERNEETASGGEVWSEMLRAINGAVCSGMVSRPFQVLEYLGCTMTGCSKAVGDSARVALEWLCGNGLIRWITEEEKYEPKVLGLAINASGMSPTEALFLKGEIDHARKYGIVLDDDVHLLYLCVPLKSNLNHQTRWDTLLQLFEQDDMSGRGARPEKIVMERLGLTASFLSNPSRRGRTPEAKDMIETLKGRGQRFFLALVLRELARERPLMDITEQFGTGEPFLRGLQEDASLSAQMMTVFCERMNYLDMSRLLENLQTRIAFGVKHDILVLAEIPNIKAGRARQLYLNNIRSPADVVRRGRDGIAQILAGSGNRVTPKNQNLAAKILKGAIDWCKHKLQEEEAKRAELRECVGEGTPVRTGGESELSLGIGRITNSTLRISDRTETAKRPTTVPSDTPGRKRARFSPAEAEMLLAPGGAGFTSIDVSNASFREALIVEARTKWKKLAFILHHQEPENQTLHFPKIGSRLSSAGGTPDDAGIRGVAIAASFHMGGGTGGVEARRTCYVPYSSVNGEIWLQVLAALLSSPAEKYTYHMKVQLRILGKVCSLAGFNASPFYEAADSSSVCDVLLMRWMNEPGSASENFVRGVREASEGLVDETMRGSVEGALKPSGAQLQGGGRACRDARLCLEMARSLCPKLMANNLWAQTKAEMPVVALLARMEDTGVPFCSGEFDTMERKVQKRLDKLQEIVNKHLALTGRGGVKISEAGKLGERLFLPQGEGGLGLPYPPPDPQKQGKNKARQTFSTNKETLQFVRLALKTGFTNKPRDERDKIEESCALLDSITEFRTLAKLMGNLQSLPHHAQEFQGRGKRFATNFFQTSSKTGRITTEEPNLQCLQKGAHFKLSQTCQSLLLSSATRSPADSAGQKDHEIVLRSCVRARKGWVILSADWSQIELRIMAHFTQDSTLLECFRSKGDFFRHLAASWKKIDPASVTQEERDQVKTMAYGLVYGMGNNSLAKKMDVSDEEARQLRGDLESRLGGFNDWKRAALAACKKEGYVQTLGGRKRFFDFKGKSPDDLAKNEREAINTIFQGSAADILKRTMLRVDLELSQGGLAADCLLVLEVHDELVFEVKEGRLAEAVALVSRLMRAAAKDLKQVELDVKIMVGPSWGDLHPYHGP